MRWYARLKALMYQMAMCGVVAATLVAACWSANAAETPAAGVGLEDIFNLEVTSVSKKPEHLQDVASSIYVVSAEDIRRAGATSLQDILRLVPGVWIADQTNEVASMGIREAANLFQQSVNVLVDGVPVTSPVNGGLYFMGFQLPLHEIVRVEVIKGPGGTIYGANSATGIINIVTAGADESLGPRFAFDGGTQEYLSPSVRYGHRFSDQLSASAFFRFRNQAGFERNPLFDGDTVTVTGYNRLANRDTTFALSNKFTDPREGLHRGFVAGVKAKLKPSGPLTFQLRGWGQVDNGYEYTSAGTPWSKEPDIASMLEYGSTGRFPNRDSVWLERVKNNSVVLSVRSDVDISAYHQGFAQAYIARYNQILGSASGGTVYPRWTTIEGEAQDNFRVLDGRVVDLDLIAGASARAYLFDPGTVEPCDTMAFTTFIVDDKSEYVVAGFLQGCLALGSPVDLTLGLKAETWTLIDIRPELMPNARIRFRPVESFMAWAAVSRSVTTPGYIQTSVESRQYAVPPDYVWQLNPESERVPKGAGKWVTVVNSDAIHPVEYITGEAGTRIGIIPGMLFLDASGFYGKYDGKIEVSDSPKGLLDSVVSSQVNAESVVPLYYRNEDHGRNLGGEIVVTSKFLKRIDAELSYAFFGKTAYNRDGTQRNKDNIFSSPAHVCRGKISARLPFESRITAMGLYHSVYNDVTTYDYVNQKFTVENIGKKVQVKPGLRLDITVEKRFVDGAMRVALWGKNILVNEEVESYGPYILSYPHTVGRSFGGTISFDF